MRKLLALSVVGLAFALPTRAGDDDTKAFFNGKDFAGFEGLIDQFWKVEDGAIVGRTTKQLNFNTFLCTKKKYGDFELSFQVKLPKGNSGVQIRSNIFEPKTFAVAGPQCDMGEVYWGCLYGEHFGGMMKQADKNVVKKVLKADDFNDYAIKAVGKHITIKLNGATTVDDDFPKAPDEGIIAFQIHSGPPMEVIFRNIRFKDLGGKK